MERYWPLVVFVLCLGNLAGDTLARLHHGWWAVLFYATSFLWIPLLNQEWASLTKMVTMYGVTAYVLAILVGVFFLHEPVTPLQWVGVVLGFIGLICVSV